MLVVDNLSVFYGKAQALTDVTLQVNAGEIVTIIGANGAGKTTLLRTISGLVRPRSGQILFEGKPVHQARPDEIVRKGIAHIPEGRKIFYDLTVLDNLEVGAFTRSDAGIKDDIDRVFTLFPRLAERRRQLAGTMSGGEQQMLAIGRALMSRPRIFLFDEPSMGLAPVIVQELFELIKRLHREGNTILLVEQNAQAALSISDRGYVIETGNVVKSAPAAALLGDPAVRDAYLGHRAS
ncbi:MAG TPA: ABC transporter ATP-binding protein [Symbiobacteriaceae bacterium]|nr:ABC transporter ATP-binding protein [Symbiobacteriaceae bacterium]